jgi:uncharacterized protein involved in exopolysaccharide biosynthesis
MAAVTQPPGLPLWSDYVAFVRRHRRRFLACMGVGLVLGYGWSLTQPTSFSATASVALTPVPMYVTASTTDLPPPPVTIDTDAQLLHSPRVVEAVATALGTDNRTAAQRLSVSASPNSDALHITVMSRNAQTAAQAANAAVAAFIQVRRSALGSLQPKQLSHLQLAIDGQERLLTKTAVLPANNDLFAQVFDLQTRLQELEDARAEPANVISLAAVPPHRDYPNTEVPVVSGAMLGLLLAWLWGAGLDRSARRGRVPSRASAVRNPFGDLPNPTTLNGNYHHAV